eukprot:PhF_6_TR6177/c0_g1_i1/m.9245
MNSGFPSRQPLDTGEGRGGTNGGQHKEQHKMASASFSIRVVRNHVDHVLFVDLDSVPNFFRFCDDRHNSSRHLIPEGTFVWVFLSRRTEVRKALGDVVFYYLLIHQKIEVDYVPGTREDSTDVALAMCLGQQHQDLMSSIRFTVVSNALSCGDVVSRLRDTRDIQHVRNANDMWVDILMNRMRGAQQIESSSNENHTTSSSTNRTTKTNAELTTQPAPARQESVFHIPKRTFHHHNHTPQDGNNTNHQNNENPRKNIRELGNEGHAAKRVAGRYAPPVVVVGGTSNVKSSTSNHHDHQHPVIDVVSPIQGNLISF